MSDKIKEPFAFVIFGGSGDLSRRKLIPSLYHLASLDYMPEKYAVVGTSRSSMNDESFREVVRSAVQDHQKEDNRTDSAGIEKLLPFVYYQPADTTKLEAFAALKAKLEQLDSQLGLHGNRLFYFA